LGGGGTKLTPGGGAVGASVDPRWQVKQVTFICPSKSCWLIRCAIRSIARAVSFLSFASDAKSKVDIGFPSSPTWQ